MGLANPRERRSGTPGAMRKRDDNAGFSGSGRRRDARAQARANLL